jgi:hypothetical protein
MRAGEKEEANKEEGSKEEGRKEKENNARRRTTKSRALAGMLALGILVCCGVVLSAQKAPAVTVAGTWALVVDAGPHGETTMGLTLAQEGRKVTGTFASPHGDLKVAGEFADRTLTFKTTGDDAPAISCTAKLKDDGTLEGFLSSERGDMKWTAKRVPER